MELAEIKLDIISVLNCKSAAEIEDLTAMKAGMTNDSYSFTYKGRKYIYRTPGAGSLDLVNRQQEYEAYKAIRWLNISDTVIYYDKKTGIKISEFIENAHTCDPYDMNQIKKCLLFAKNELHKKKKIINSKIDLPQMINKYERLMGKSKYPDYQEVKDAIFSKIRHYKKEKHDYCLCHFDLNPDNFLLRHDRVWLLDWEYAGMNDPYFDVAGWIVYKPYSEKQVNKIISIYLEHEPSEDELAKFYACIAAMGLLWSNWCEYKRKCGEEFGEYAEQQFNYAKKYIKMA